MTMTMYDGAGGRAAPVSGVTRHAMARAVVARNPRGTPRINARLFGLDDAGVATVAPDRRPIETFGGCHLPL